MRGDSRPVQCCVARMTKYNASIQSTLRQNLLDWFDSHQREMPWRSEKSLYRVWVSEIMLQQTQVVTVIPYFERFLERFPDVESLAEADEATVLTFWEGLGYYRRARLLHQAAKTIVSDFGRQFPKSFDAVLGLPGIGRYTAGAILSIADNQPLPILEGNTIRVHARLAGVTGDVQKSGTQKSLWSLATSVVDPERPGDLNQALMELGSEVCTPKKPQCGSCPVHGVCNAFQTKRQLELPYSSKKIRLTPINESVILIQRRGKFLLRQCVDGERWAGLWDFPRFQTDEDGLHSDLEAMVHASTGLSVEIRDTGWSTRHGVTRFKIHLRCWVAEKVQGRLRKTQENIQWVDRHKFEDFPMSVTGRKVATELDSLITSQALFP